MSCTVGAAAADDTTSCRHRGATVVSGSTTWLWRHRTGRRVALRRLAPGGGSGHTLAAEGSQPDAIVLAPRSWRADLGGPDERLRELTYASRVATTLAQLGRVDVIHDHCGFATLVAACAADVAPVVHTVHGDIPEAYATFYSSVVDHARVCGDQRRRSAAALPDLAVDRHGSQRRRCREPDGDADAEGPVPAVPRANLPGQGTAPRHRGGAAHRYARSCWPGRSKPRRRRPNTSSARSNH